MSPSLPTLTEARQLARLRSLRVQRAREAIAPAQDAVTRALEVVHQRQQRIERLREQLVALREAVAGALAPQLPRWGAVVLAQREHLADQLERQEYALLGDDRELEAAQEKLQQARAELTRALAREDAVRGLVHDARRARALVHEQRAERELDDSSRSRATAGPGALA